MVHEFTLHPRHQITGGPKAAARVKGDGALAQPLIGRTEQIIHGQSPAPGKAVSLLASEAKMFASEGPLSAGHGPWRRAMSHRHPLKVRKATGGPMKKAPRRGGRLEAFGV
jgi:hypothetical protein